MKKITIALFLAGYLFATQVSAQNSVFGAKGGLNFSNMTVEGNNDQNLKFGFHAGVFNKISISEFFAVQPELLYSGKGFKNNFDNIIFVDGEAKFNLNYIDFPVKLVYNLAPDFDFHFGPYVGYLASANVETNAEVLDYFDVSTQDELDRDNFKTFDVGLTAGMGFTLDPVILGFNYNLGLTKVAKDDRPTEEMLGDARNTVIQVFVGIMF
jgi:hypothetical protein